MHTEKLFGNDFESDAYLIVSEINRFYFTGFSSSFGLLLLTPGGGYFATDYRYMIAAEEKLNGKFKLFFGSYDECHKHIADIVASLGIHSIGIEDESLTYAEFLNLQKQYVAYTLVPSSRQINLSRVIKTDDEIAAIAKSEEIASLAFTKVLNQIKSGITERDLSIELEYQLKKLGGEGLSFDSIVAFGANSAKPHAVPGDKKLVSGDIILMDYGTIYGGYCSDITRTVCFGKGNETFAHIYDIVLRANKYAIESIKAGISCREADSFAREFITANSYGNEFGHGLGHGVGLEIHEAPTVNKISDTVLEENMLITVEPGIYLKDVGGVRIEDLVVVKKDGTLNLTTANKEMIIL